MFKRSGLIWKNLINNRCPQCGEPIKRINDFDNFSCSRCHFFCPCSRGKQIILDIELRQEEAHRDKLADDFLNERA